MNPPATSMGRADLLWTRIWFRREPFRTGGSPGTGPGAKLRGGTYQDEEAAADAVLDVLDEEADPPEAADVPDDAPDEDVLTESEEPEEAEADVGLAGMLLLLEPARESLR